MQNETIKTNKLRGFFLILTPAATVFISSFCVMALELVAGRLVAKELGFSLYTWTAVIGVILAGITVGYYISGRIADKFDAKKALAALFALSSAACVLTIILNNTVGEWLWLWYLGWPMHIFTYVMLVFLLPSMLLGMISPVVAKMALDKGLPQGRTVGDIYAWGAAGSIAGTFAAGFYLIPAIGTIPLIWTVGGILILLAILYRRHFWPFYLWMAAFVIVLLLGTSSSQSCKTAAAALLLRSWPDPQVIYEDEGQYCYIAVKRTSSTQDKRLFMQDKLMHCEIIMGDIDNLIYFYTVVFAAVTHNLAPDNNPISVFHIGGGGYVFPRYIEKNWPGSRNDVAEIDPRVTEAAIQAFGLERNTKINTIQLDARNYVDELLQMKKAGKKIPTYDFIYEDAFSDYSVPFQLVTKEFNDKLSEILTDNGVYIINTIDVYDSGLFTGAYINTLKKTFPYVYVVASNTPKSGRSLFVLLASKRQIDAAKAMRDYRPSESEKFWCLNDSEMQTLIEHGRGTVLTDNYVPVENMLAPVVNRSSIDLLTGKLEEKIAKLKEQGAWDNVIAIYKQIIELDPAMALLACNELGMVLVQQNRLTDAVDIFKKAIELNNQSPDKIDAASIHYNLGFVLKTLNRKQEAAEQFLQAIEGFKKELVKDPNSAQMMLRLGLAYADSNNLPEAVIYVQKAVDTNPIDVQNHIILTNLLMAQGKFDEAKAGLQKAIGFMNYAGQKEAVTQLQSLLNSMEMNKSPNKQ